MTQNGSGRCGQTGDGCNGWLPLGLIKEGVRGSC